jgi:hypothetical protein
MKILGLTLADQVDPGTLISRSLSGLWESEREFGWARTDFAGFAGQ